MTKPAATVKGDLIQLGEGQYKRFLSSYTVQKTRADFLRFRRLPSGSSEADVYGVRLEPFHMALVARPKSTKQSSITSERLPTGVIVYAHLQARKA